MSACKAPWGYRKVNPDNPNEVWCSYGHVVPPEEMLRRNAGLSLYASCCRYHHREAAAARSGGRAHVGTGSWLGTNFEQASTEFSAVNVLLVHYVNTSTPILGIHECGAVVRPCLSDIRNKKGPCVGCGNRVGRAKLPGGINARTLGRNPAWSLDHVTFYLIVFTDLAGERCMKWGIDGRGDRTKRHLRAFPDAKVVYSRVASRCAARAMEERLDAAHAADKYRPIAPDGWSGGTEVVYAYCNPIRTILRHQRLLDIDATELHVALAMDLAHDEHSRTLKEAA